MRGPLFRPLTIVLALLALLVIATLLGIRIGAVPLTNRQLWDIITGVRNSSSTIVLDVRLPRVVLGLLAGMALAVAGSVWQGVLRNPLADPYLIGISAGAALGAAVALFFLPAFPGALPFLALVGALLAVALVFLLARAGGKLTIERLLLCGVAVGSFLSAMLSLLAIAKSESIAGLYIWMLGGLSGRSWADIAMILPYLAVGGVLVGFQLRNLNVLQLGEETARSLGINTNLTTGILALGATLLAAGTVSLCGMIGFVGLIVPHMTRRLVGSDLRLITPISALMGAVILIMADLIARTCLAPAEVPVGIIMALLGAPFFLYLVYKR